MCFIFTCRYYLKCYIFVSQLEALNIPYTVQSFLNTPKEGLIKGLWKNHSHEPQVQAKSNHYNESTKCLYCIFPSLDRLNTHMQTKLKPLCCVRRFVWWPTCPWSTRSTILSCGTVCFRSCWASTW